MAVAIDQVKSLAQEHSNELAFVVNHSGGKDSTTMLRFIRKEFPDSPTYAVMADTGFEHVLPISAAYFARARCAEFGLELTVVRNQKRTYLEVVEQRGMFPSRQYRQCTSDLKRGPIEKFVRSLPQKVILNCMGVRGEESNPRAQLHPLTLNRSLSTQQRPSTTGFRSLIAQSRTYWPGIG